MHIRATVVEFNMNISGDVLVSAYACFCSYLWVSLNIFPQDDGSEAYPVAVVECEYKR